MYRNKVIPLKMNEQELGALDRLAAYDARNRSEAMREIIRAALVKRGFFHDQPEQKEI